MSYVLRQNTPIKMRNSCQAIIGSPAQVAHQLHELIEVTQVDQILWQIDFGGQPFHSSMETLKLFSTKVLPLIKGAKCHETI